MEKILEGNKLIAEFMGFESKNQEWRNPYPTLAHKIKDRWYPTQNLEFHSSWDWLMPVVEKIFQQDEEIQQFSGNEIFELGICAPLHDVWQAVIQFIQWYNKTKQ